MPQTDADVSEAVRTILLGVSPSLFPQTTLSAPSIANATSVTGADLSRFAPGTLLSFNDGTAERTPTITSITANTATLSFTGMNQTGLVYPHSAGAGISANCYVGMPLEPGANLAFGDPLVSVMVRREELFPVTMPVGFEHVYTVHLDYMRSLVPPAGQTMDINLWALEQQAKARADLATMRTALMTNPTLMTASGAHAVSLGSTLGGGGAVAMSDWSQLTGFLDIHLFVAALEVIYFWRADYHS